MVGQGRGCFVQEISLSLGLLLKALSLLFGFILKASGFIVEGFDPGLGRGSCFGLGSLSCSLLGLRHGNDGSDL